jgi:hypothetical protein
MRKLFAFIVIAVLLAGCKKEEVMPSAPEIALVSMSAQSVHEFDERVKVRFSYKDGDGDLGQSDPDDYTLWVKDARLGGTDGYHIPPLAPEDAEVPIQGELEVELNALFLLGNSGQEETSYTMYVVDRAGNRSNEFTTGTITITTDSL